MYPSYCLLWINQLLFWQMSFVKNAIIDLRSATCARPPPRRAWRKEKAACAAFVLVFKVMVPKIPERCDQTPTGDDYPAEQYHQYDLSH